MPPKRPEVIEPYSSNMPPTGTSVIDFASSATRAQRDLEVTDSVAGSAANPPEPEPADSTSYTMTTEDLAVVDFSAWSAANRPNSEPAAPADPEPIDPPADHPYHDCPDVGYTQKFVELIVCQATPARLAEVLLFPDLPMFERFVKSSGVYLDPWLKGFNRRRQPRYDIMPETSSFLQCLGSPAFEEAFKCLNPPRGTRENEYIYTELTTVWWMIQLAAKTPRRFPSSDLVQKKLGARDALHLWALGHYLHLHYVTSSQLPSDYQLPDNVSPDPQWPPDLIDQVPKPVPGKGPIPTAQEILAIEHPGPQPWRPEDWPPAIKTGMNPPLSGIHIDLDLETAWELDVALGITPAVEPLEIDLDSEAELDLDIGLGSIPVVEGFDTQFLDLDTTLGGIGGDSEVDTGVELLRLEAELEAARERVGDEEEAALDTRTEVEIEEEARVDAALAAMVDKIAAETQMDTALEVGEEEKTRPYSHLDYLAGELEETIAEIPPGRPPRSWERLTPREEAYEAEARHNYLAGLWADRQA